ncbi:uncharacterized protein EI90DRAFT_1010518 [Cantharellus anzutake]|uniref:uncharacterized protein n=1 Tax=Cantharellus anzutake TaxID=1750568 RepID=UPI001904760E|nr:uncharacterized protein EI90DRAFT_1010518 [Cantharellus anzutake]KAF8331333.1 hypothetical protein EI90DRAFT_1010518 [Cantharellus anzutake]
MEVEVYSTLKPISSIVHLPQRITEAPRFYHATAKEFIIGEPIGDASDQSFFINDTNGYSLGLSLLRFLKSTFKWNDLAMPTDRPLGNKEKWEEFQGKGQPDHVEYAVKYLFSHLDPSKLFSRDSNELQQEFDHFLTNNLLSFIALSGGEFELPDELLQSNNHDSTELLREAKRAHEYVIERHERLRDRRALFSRLQFGEHDVPWTFDPWHIFRSMLPFTRPTSSPLFKLYRHLADPIRIFTISGEFTGHLIPLSKHAINAQNVMETKLSGLRKAFDSEGPEIINYRAQYSDPDICKGIVTSTAISKDGRYIALGFGNGGIEVVDIDQQHAITQFQCDLRDPIAWIDFISGSCRIAAEDDEGNIFIFDRGLQPLKLGTLPGGHYPPVTAVADNGSFIIRLPRHLGSNWYKSVAILYVLEEPSIHILSFPSTIPTPLRLNSPHGPVPPFPPPVPCGLALKLSPGARYVVACDREHAFVWSTESCEFITSHNLLDFEAFVTNTAPYRPYIISGNVKSSKGSIPHIQGSRTENDIDASWVELLFHRLSQKKAYVRERQEPLGVLKPKLWLRNTLELILPIEYHPVLLTRELRNRPQEWYGDRVIGGEDFVYFPHASKDGTRFLVQGHMRAPIVVDISQIV